MRIDFLRQVVVPASVVFACAVAINNRQPVYASEPLAHRVYGQWVSGKISGGGYIQRVVSTSKRDLFYAYVDVGGAFRSTDGGNTWRSVHSFLGATRGAERVRGLVVDPSNPDTLLIATGTTSAGARTGVYKSTDGGSSWTNTLSAWFSEGQGRADGYVLVNDPTTPTRMFAASAGDGVFVSNDTGDTWTELGLKSKFFHGITPDPLHPGCFWITGRTFTDWIEGKLTTFEGGLWYYNGKQFDEILAADDAPTEIVIDATSTGRLVASFHDQATGATSTRIRSSIDGGRTWVPLEDGLSINGNNGGYDLENRYQAFGEGPDFLTLASGHGTFYQLTKGANSWSAVPYAIDDTDWWGKQGPGQNYSYFARATGSMTIDPFDANRWFFTDFYSVWRSTDAGANWKRSTDGIECTVINWISQGLDGRTYVGAADVGFFISIDGGLTSRQSPETNNVKPNGVTNNVRQIEADQTDGGKRVYVIGGSDGASQQSKALFRSIDAGEHWDRQAISGLPEGAIFTTLQIDPTAGRTVYLAVAGDPVDSDGKSLSGGVYRSSDEGMTFTKFGVGLGSKRPDGNNFFDPQTFYHAPELAVSGDGTAVATSYNAGELYYLDRETETWTYTWPGINGRMTGVWADPRHTGRFYILSEYDGVYRSNDGGKTWEKITLPKSAAPVSRYMTIDRFVDGRLAISTKDGFLYSADDGVTWVQLPRTMPDRWGANPIAFAGDRLVSGSSGSGIYSTPLPVPGVSATVDKTK